MNKRLEILSLINDMEHCYLSSIDHLKCNTFRELQVNEFKLYLLKQNKEQDIEKRLRAQNTILTAMREESIYVLYLILGIRGKVEYYYGIIPDLRECEEDARVHVEQADELLHSVLLLNWCPQVYEPVNNDEKLKLMYKLRKYSHVSVIEGVPELRKSSNQQVFADDIGNGMKNDDFALIYIGKPLSNLDIADLENKFGQTQRMISTEGGRTIVTQRAASNSSTLQLNNVNLHSTSHNQSVSKGISFLDFTDDAIATKKEIEAFLSTSVLNQHPGFTFNDSPTLLNDLEKRSKHAKAVRRLAEANELEVVAQDNSIEIEFKGVTKNESESLSQNRVRSSSCSVGNNNGRTRTRTNIMTQIERNQSVKDWEDYIQNHLKKRSSYSKGRAGYLMNGVILSNSRPCSKKLETLLRCMYCGDDGSKIPMKTWDVSAQEDILEAIYKLQIPVFRKVDEITAEAFEWSEQVARSVFSQLVYPIAIAGGYFASSQELSQIMGPPII